LKKRRILIGIDGSPDSLRAVDHVGAQFKGIKDLRITLLHALPGLPPEFWDDGHILNEGERAEREKVVKKWLSNQKKCLKPMFDEASNLLIKKGIDPDQIKCKTIPQSLDIVASILEESKNGGYQTLVIGRCGRSSVSHTLLGSISSKIVNQGAGIAVCVVE
jgi:nucleotide-binding universal stress UspA family protein